MISRKISRIWTYAYKRDVIPYRHASLSSPSAGWLHAPHVELKDALADGASSICLVDALRLGHLHAGLQGGVVDGLKDVTVQFLGLREVWKSQMLENYWPTNRLHMLGHDTMLATICTTVWCLPHTSGLSNGIPSSKKASARPWQPMPMGRCLKLDFSAVLTG